jgi:competence protein ComEC
MPIEPGDSASLTQRAVINASGGISETNSTVATDGGTDTSNTDGSDVPLAITEINADAEGDDRENLNDEYLVFTNTDDESLDLSGWTVQDESGMTYTFPDGTTLQPGADLTLRTGSGEETDNELYWGANRPIWNNNGDTVIITNSNGEQILTEGY